MKKQNPLQGRILSLTRIHFALVGLMAGVTIVSDAWNLIPPSVLLQRWTLAVLILLVNGAVWYLVRSTSSATLQQAYVWLIALADMAVATILVFSQRGMASKAVIFYILPLMVVAVLRSRVALVTSAIAAFAAYSLAIIRYFVTSPGEGYKVELYAEMLLYGGFFFLIAALLYALVREK